MDTDSCAYPDPSASRCLWSRSAQPSRGGAFSASAQVVIRERVEVAPPEPAPRAASARAEGAAVVGGSAWPGGVRGSGTVTVSGGLRLLGGDPADLTLSVFTSRTRHDVDLGAATFSSNRTQCSTTYPAEGPAGDGVRGYALPDDLLSFRVGPAERLDSLVLTGAGVRVSTPHRIEPESAYQDNQWETDFPKRGCHWLFTRTLDRNNACGCVAGAPDQSDGAVALNWTFAPDPPAALAVSVGPDTLDYYGDGPAYYTGVVGAQSVYGDGTHAPYDGGELTYAAETPFGSLKWEACGRTTCGAPVRVPVATGAYKGRQKIRFVADGDPGGGRPRREDGPEYDAPVAVRVSGTLASGAGVTGAATVVVRGRAGPGPDSLAVTLADAEVPCGDSTRVTVRAVLDGEDRALPDTARVRLAVADSSRAVLSWGGVSGPSVEVPVGAVRDSAAVGVWVTTRGCAETAGFLRVDVLAEADAYWDVDGTVTGRGTTIVLGGANGGGGEDDEEDTASGSLGLPIVMLRQDDTQVSVLPDPYVMVSKVRPDWLLPTARVAFRSPFAGHRPFENDLAQPDTAVHFDPDTYRPELLGVPDSLVSQGDRIEFVLRVVPGLLGKGLDGGSELRARGAAKAPAAAHRAGSVVGPGSAGAYRARADQFVRFVSNGRPASGAASSCSPWPPPDAGMESDGGACRYDDEVAGDQTILVRLLDTVRVTALYNGTDGVTDTLGTATWRVGLPGTEDGIDAVRRVNLVWHDYVQADGTRLTSAPAEVARRVSEDFAQASISVSSIGAATTFRSDEIETVLEIEVSTPPDVPGQVELEVVKNDGSVVPVVVPYPAEATAETVAFLIAQELASSTVGASPDFPYPGSNDGEFWYVAVNSGLAQEVRIVNGGASNGVTILTQLEFLESVRLGSEAASAAGWAVADQDRSTIDALTVPRIAIQHGDPSDQTYAYALPGTEPRLFVTEEVADGDDREGAHVAAHEIGHLLLPEPFGPDGGPECADDQVDSHHPAPYNLMFCEALLNGEWEGGPKRLTPEQHRQTRLQNGNRSTVPLLKRP